MTAAEDSFRQARIHAARHMAACESANLRWSETSITEIVTAQAARAVTVVPFTQRAEALSGADWIWWWVDGASAYGMLVQAKRVTVRDCKWSFDFGYEIGGIGRLQREVLRSTARTLDLLPVYALYLGTGDYRRWERCSETHRSGRCLACVKRTISLMPELVASELIMTNAASAYESSVALEELWTPPTEAAPLSPLLESQLAPELAEFLQTPQSGTRAITRSMIDRVLRARMGTFSAPSPIATSKSLGEHDQLGPVFENVPDDTGHFGLPYFEQTLRPLRHAPPPYVVGIMTNDFDEERLQSNLPENIAGVVVGRPPQHGG